MHDVIIVGGGPAGLSAAVYAARACLDAILIEKMPMGGGQVRNTCEVDNYPGIPGIGGFELGQRFEEHARRLGICPVAETVREISCCGAAKRVVTDKGEHTARTLVLATGAVYRKLGVPGEQELSGAGVSYCATCDGAFFRGKTVAVVGGGDVALEDALFLARGCEKVYLIHRREEFRGARVFQEKVRQTPKIQLVLNSVVEEIRGQGQVQEARVLDKGTGEESLLAVSGVFIAAGMVPDTRLVEGQLGLDENGYIIAGEDCRTDAEGVYAAGDVRTKALRQVVTAAADGANAIFDIEKYLAHGN